jgi:YHS domain-containing protein
LILAALGLGAIALGRTLLRQQGQVTGRSEGPLLDELVQDPQCGVYIPKSQAISRVVNGERRFFCSRACVKLYGKGH